MSEKEINELFQSGVSVIIKSSSDQDAQNLEQLLTAFLQHNTHHPFEIIVVETASGNAAEAVIEKYFDSAFFVFITSEQNCSFAQSSYIAAKKAIYPNLLFLSNKFPYAADDLPPALEKLGQLGTGVVAICPEGDSAVSFGQESSIIGQQQGYGIFLLCSKEDFEAAAGFSGQSEEGYEVIDFCLRLQTKLEKKSVLCGPLLLSSLLMWLS